MSEDIQQTRALIIGAGPAGLAVGAALQEVGITSVLLEQGATVGPRWHQHYERLHLHTARRTSALPGLPFPADYPRYPSRQQVIDYLDHYARRFHLDVRFNCRAVSARHTLAGWHVETNTGIFQTRNLIVAIGINNKPHRPEWPNQSLYEGQILHSADYRNGVPFRGQPVLVVGFGNSGAEIALDLAEHGAKAAASVRHPINIVRRDLYGLPIQWWSIALTILPPRLADLVNLPSHYLYHGDLERYGLRKASYGPATQSRILRSVPMIDVGTVAAIRAGKIQVYPGIQEFTSTGVRFTDGRAVTFSAVVLATGYEMDLAALIDDVSALVDGQGYPLTNGRETALPGLYFCGLDNAATGLLRQIGIEARQIAREIRKKENSI